MSRVLAIILLIALTAQAAVVVPNPLNLKKHHGAMCDVCKALVEGGEKVGDDDLDAWLDVNIGTLCWTMLLPIHHECEKELKAVKKELKKDIENKEAPEKACEDVDLC
ncbi:unnamed protein product [Caenorhabditis angaria]|uniref:Saposin B-type domain-containing protein n=1 Tax=Caenorhabditis angaria TaxID=860376 RepID=A0A9P1IL01_9PELO|nr:unnamed protein product [Caenorhabditis angaria]